MYCTWDETISGCGPLPKTGGLSWETRSGRPVQENSTVYEEYFPRCPRGGALNSEIRSIRCWETLRWDVHPGNLHCTGTSSHHLSCILADHIWSYVHVLMYVFFCSLSPLDPPFPKIYIIGKSNVNLLYIIIHVLLWLYFGLSIAQLNLSCLLLCVVCLSVSL